MLMRVSWEAYEMVELVRPHGLQVGGLEIVLLSLMKHCGDALMVKSNEQVTMVTKARSWPSEKYGNELMIGSSLNQLKRWRLPL